MIYIPKRLHFPVISPMRLSVSLKRFSNSSSVSLHVLSVSAHRCPRTSKVRGHPIGELQGFLISKDFFYPFLLPKFLSPPDRFCQAVLEIVYESRPSPLLPFSPSSLLPFCPSAFSSSPAFCSSPLLKFAIHNSKSEILLPFPPSALLKFSLSTSTLAL